MKYLLDTTACIDLLRGQGSVVSRLESVAPDDCGVSTVTAYELFCGVLKCKDPDREARKVERLLLSVHHVEFDLAAARKTAQTRRSLESRGQRIGPYDVMLAGQALGRGLVLVTSNIGEFERVDGLKLEDWRANGE